MVDRYRWLDVLSHGVLWMALLVMGFPLFYAFVASTLPLEKVVEVPMPLLPGSHLLENVAAAWHQGHLGRVLLNSVIMAGGITVGKIAISILSAFAITYFRFPLRNAAFWAIFLTLMLPVEVRIVPTYQVVANVLGPLAWLAQVLHVQGLLNALGFRVRLHLEWSLLDSYLGLTLPLIASATATFLYRQFFLTIPEELAEAAKIDGAGPLRFFWSILVPMSRTNTAALVVILFLYGWNQYLWPLLITTRPQMITAMIDLTSMMPSPDQVQAWNVTMAGALLILLPPLVVVLLMQRWFVKGLIESEK